MIVAVSLGVLGLTGFVIALYFTLMRFTRMNAYQRFIPPVCRMDEQTCLSLLDTAEARLFGVPNSAPGLLYYALIMSTAVLLIGGNPLPLPTFVIAISTASAVVSIYLAYSLLFRIKIQCILCFTSHVINMLILLLLIRAQSI